MTTVKAIVEEINSTDHKLSELNMTPVEMRSMLYFLAGADPTTMQYAIRFIENQRVQGAQYTAWKSCPASIKFNTPAQHDAGCTTCRKES